MTQIVIRFFVGGLVVSSFAIFGDILRPKSFAGLFGAAPSVALATLALTVAVEGPLYAASEARSMIAGAIAFFAYASLVSWILMRGRSAALIVTVAAMPVWFGLAFGLWHYGLRRLVIKSRGGREEGSCKTSAAPNRSQNENVLDFLRVRDVSLNSPPPELPKFKLNHDSRSGE